MGVDVGRTTAFNPPPPLWFDFHAAEGICVFFVARMMSLQSSFLFCLSVFGSVCLLGGALSVAVSGGSEAAGGQGKDDDDDLGLL